MLAVLYGVYVAGMSWARPDWAPALPPEERERVQNLGREVLRVLVPPLVLVLVVLGSIFAGIATPTEAGALGAVGAMLLAAAHGRLDRENVFATAEATLRVTCMVIFLLVGSTAFTMVFRGPPADVWIEEHLTNLPGGKIGRLVGANLAVFVLGFFIDFFEIAFIVLPLIAPAARKLGIVGDEMVWFSVLLAMNLQTSFLTPPFGFSLFYLRGVAPPEVTTGAIYRGVVPFIGVQLVGLALVWCFPEIVTALLPS